jgi:divalent metal cation (Fe/Co/Zn/Cd) transporter
VSSSVAAAPPGARTALIRRSRTLTRATLAYNVIEGLVAVGAALASGSVALLGFGIDSFIEVAASVAALWRLRADRDVARREVAERRTLRVIGISFLLLAAYVTADAAHALWARTPPEESWPGVVLAVASLVVMPWLARSKRAIATTLHSGALTAEARQTDICFYLSAILLAGLVLNATVGWWWADPVAGLVMVPLIAWEGVAGLRGRNHCADCAPDALDKATS